jgi:tRNA(fMet)-specific endonuclease VapC
MKYMLDSNICIYFINSRSGGVMAKIKSHMQDGLAISAITLAELEHGVALSAYPQRNAIALHQFLAILEVLPFDSRAAAAYGDIHADLQRKGNKIGPLDMLIAGHARAEDMTLVTNNMKEFVRVEGLTVENWA